jgi:hypothetical protein
MFSRHWPDFLTSILLGLAALLLVATGEVAQTGGGFAFVAILAASGLISWRLGRERNRSAGSDWDPVLQRLDRIATALESRPMTVERAEPPVDLSAVELALAERRWEAAETLLAKHADHPRAARLAEELDSARRAIAADLLGELNAALEVNDPERVLEIHATLATTLPSEGLTEHESRIVKWSLALIMKRLRTGTVRPDVAGLAARVAERFPKTVEGASLRASLPTLRRSAGLCARCAKPYRGIADACPECLAGPPLADQSPGDDGDPSLSTIPPAESLFLSDGP